MRTIVTIFILSCAGCIPIIAGLVESDRTELGQLVCKTKEGYTSCNPNMGGYDWFDPSDESRHSCETKGAMRGDRCLVGRDEGRVR